MRRQAPFIIGRSSVVLAAGRLLTKSPLEKAMQKSNMHSILMPGRSLPVNA